MNNPFDQFDVVEPSAAQNNPFDQFDEPVRDADEVNAEINAAMTERQPAPDRNWGEVATDTGKALMGGFANLGGAAGQLADVGARATTMGPRLMAEASDAVGLTDDLGRRLGDAVGAPGHAIQRITGDAANYWNAQKSDAMKAAQQKLQAAGDAGTGFMDEATETAKVLWENPMLLGDILAGSAPNLLIPGAAARGAGTIAARNALAKGGSEAAAKTAATKAATKAGIGAGGVLEGAAAGSETRRDVMQMTPEQLIAGSAAYGRLIEEGYDHKSAVEQIAFNAGLTAQAIVTPISMLMGAATGAGKVEAEFFTGQGVKNLFSAVAKEAVQETGQEAGAAFGGNVGTKLYADKDQRLTEGLGQGAVLGAAAGAGQTAGMRVTGGLVGAVANSNHEQGGTQQSNPELEPEPDNSVAAPKMPAPGDQVSWVTPNGEQPAIFAGEVEGPNGQPFAQISIDGVDSYVPMDQLQWGQTPRLLDATPESIEAELESGNVEAEAEFNALMGEADAHREANPPGRENPFDQFDGIDYEPVSVGGTSLSLAPLESAQNEYEGAIEFETDQPPAIESLAGPVVDRINEHTRQQEDDAAQEAYLNETAEPLSPAGPSLPDLMNRYAPDPSANATRTANPPRLDIEVQDARLKRPEYRAQLERMAEELVKGGGIGYIRDAHDRIVGRTPSINPEWFKSLNENPETTMSVEDVQAAIKKALAGEKLGVRQLRVVGAALDAFGDERGNYARELRAMRENARQDRRRAFEQWLEATNVPLDADFEATVWPESPGDVYAETDYLPHLDMDSRAVTELMETADAFGVDWSAIDQALAEPDVTAQTRALTQLIWDARNEHRETTNQQAPRAGSAESEPRPLLGTTEALEKAPADQARRDQADSPTEELTLTTQTEQDLADRARAQQDAERAESETRQQADQRAAADRERDDFVLSGSNAEADQAAARGQGDLLGANSGRAETPQQVRGAGAVPGKGHIAHKWLPVVDGSIAPGGAKDTEAEAIAVAERWQERQQEVAREEARIRTQKDTVAGRLKSGQSVTDADLALLDLKSTSDLRWFIPAAADLFNISSRQVRPHIADMIKVGHSDMGVKREYVSSKKALETIGIRLGIPSDAEIKANTEANPTEAQKEAGNYRKASINVQGLDISIENPRGGKRSGVDPDGNAWEVTMHNHYGYIRRSEGADGEHVDVFVGPNPASEKVFIVDQANPDGSFDEHKVLIGFDSKLKARSGYKSNYSNGWKVGPITSMSMDEFKDWLKNGDTTKPLKAENQKPDKDTLSAKSETATPSTNQETAKQTLPAILTETKSQTMKKMAAEKGIKKGSPGYSDAMARLAEEYETEVDRAQAGLTFEQFNALNGDSPESINRQAHEALREEFGISEGAALYSGHERKTRNLQDRKSGIRQLQEPAADAGRGSQFDLFLHAGADKRKAYADIFGTIIKPRPITRINSAIDSVDSIEELAHLLASIRKDPQESFYAVATDNKGKVLRIMQYTRGTAGAASVYPLDVVSEAASIDNVHTLHLAHNHPSGTASASRADEVITKRIFEMLDGTGIRPGHHAIIAGTKWADGSLESGPAGTIEPRSRAAFSIPITQRRIVKRGSLGDPITSPDAALKATSNYTDALLLLNSQNAPVAAVTISAAEMSKLREGGRVNRILSAINTSNARAAIIKTDNKSAAKNLAAMLNSLNDINVLDWIDSEGSDRQRGGSVHDSSGPFFSLADRRTQSAVDAVGFDQGAGTDVSSSGATVSHEEANKVIRRILAGIRRPDLTIKPVGDFSGFPAAVKDQAAREGHDGKDVQGVIHGSSIYLNLSALRDARHVEQVIFHELYGHYGIRQLFDLGTKQAMGRLYLAIGGAKGLNQMAARHNINLTPYAKGLLTAEKSGHHDRETSLAIMAEELLAHLAQDNKPSVKRFAREAIGAIRTWLRSHGFLNLSNVSDNELFYLLKQARQVINTGTVSGQSGLLFALTAPSSARFSLSQLPPGTRKIIGDDPVLAGWTMLAQSDDVFQLPTSNKKMLTAVFKELEGERGMRVERADELALQNDYGAKMAWRVNTPSGEKAAIYQDGKSVWIDVSDLKQGEDGKRIYNAVANYAHNTDRVFIGDPAGLSDVALTRRLENMISSALKFGTTKHLWPHDRQIEGNEGMGIPGIQWKDGNDAHNLRQMIMASHEATVKQFPKIRDLRYNPEKDVFENVKTQEVWDHARFDSEANAARGRHIGLRDEDATAVGGRTPVRDRGTGAAGSGSVGSSDIRQPAGAPGVVPDRRGIGAAPTAGSATLERAVLTHSLLRGSRSEVAGILARFGRLGSERLTGPRNAILYSLNQDSEPRSQGGVSRSGVEQTSTPEFKRWFGGSKVVDADGKPLVVYHGTASDFTEFSRAKATDKNGRKLGMGWGKGKFYFADSGMAASSSAEYAQMTGRGKFQNVMPVYLSIQNPISADEYMAAVRSAQESGVSRDAAIAKTDKALRAKGIDGIIDADSGGIAVFEPTQIKSALGNTGAFDPGNADIRFSLRSDHRQTTPNPRPRPSAGVSVSEEGNSKAGSKTERPSNFQAPGTKATPFQALMDKALRKVVDKMRPLLNTQSEIEKYTGRKIDESLDAYLSEEAFHGKTENDLRKLRENYVEPLAEYLAKHDISREELDLFLWAAHAPERNKQIAKINPDMPDGGSGMTTAKAVEVLKKAQSEGKLETLKGAAKFVYDALKHRRDLMKGALLEDGTVDAWEEVYKYYVPLKGQAQNEGGSSTPRIGRGFDIRGKESFRALGRSTMPESPVLHAIRDTTETIIRFRKNEVGNVLLDLIQAYPNDDYWQVFDASHPEFERRLLKAEGKDRVGAAKVIDRSKYFITKKDGKEYYIKLHDQQLLDAMKNLGAEHLSGPLQAMAKVTRYLSSINTSLNPEFVISNFARDIQAAVYNAMAEQDLHDGRIKGQKIVGKMVADVPVAIRAIKASLSGKQLDGKAGEWQKAFDQFRDDGAKTGWYDMKDLDGQAKDLERLILLSQKGIRSDIYRAGRATLNLIDDINTAIENGVRLAVYKNAVEAGVTRKQASSLAKNLTVNFNRKGEWGAVMNSLWMFTNAAIQGNKVFYRAMATMKANPDGTKSLNKAQKAAIVMTGLAIGLAVLNRAMAGEDDDGENWYDKVPEHIKERNIVIMKSAFGGEPGEYWSFMLPYGYNIFHVMGTEFEAAYSNPQNAGKSALNILKAGVGSFVPISLAENEDAPPSITRTLAPSVVKPFADLDANKNFYGGDIFRENRFGVPKPDSHLSKRNTPESWKWAAEFLNEATGGSAYRSGKIDINPDKLDYIFKYYTGGVGAFASRTVDAGIKTSQGIELDAREIPFVRRLSGKVNHYPDQNRFYDRANEIGQLENEWRSLGGKERIAFYKEHGERIRLKGLAKATEKQLKRLRARRDAIESDASLTPREKDAKLKEIELQTKKQIDHFNKSWPKD